MCFNSSAAVLQDIVYKLGDELSEYIETEDFYTIIERKL